MIPIKLNTKLQMEEVITHFLSLEREDLRLRFGYTPTDSIVREYVESSWSTKHDKWFGVYDSGKCIATAHVCIMKNDTAELGFTVSKDYRKLGIGNKLFVRGTTWAKSLGAKQLFLHCLSENKAIQKIAKNNNMNVVILTGGEAEATIATPYDPSAKFIDNMFDGIAIYDMLLINQQKFITQFLG